MTTLLQGTVTTSSRIRQAGTAGVRRRNGEPVRGGGAMDAGRRTRGEADSGVMGDALGGDPGAADRQHPGVPSSPSGLLTCGLRRLASSSRRSSRISSRRRAAYSKRSSSAAASISSSSSTIVFSISRRLHVRALLAPAAALGRDLGVRHQELRDVGDALDDRLRRDPVLLVVGDWIARRRSVSSIAVRHRRRLLVGVHQHRAADVARRAADRLDQRGLAAEEALLVGVEDRDQRDLGRSSPSRRRLTPTSTSYSPRRSSRMIWIRSSVSISECR